MNRSFFSNFWDSYFSSYGEFYTKIGDAGIPRLVCSTPSTSPSWTLDQPGTVKVGGGPR